jgi:hypothetical protein
MSDRVIEAKSQRHNKTRDIERMTLSYRGIEEPKCRNNWAVDWWFERWDAVVPWEHDEWRPRPLEKRSNRRCIAKTQSNRVQSVPVSEIRQQNEQYKNSHDMMQHECNLCAFCSSLWHLLADIVLTNSTVHLVLIEVHSSVHNHFAGMPDVNDWNAV